MSRINPEIYAAIKAKYTPKEIEINHVSYSPVLVSEYSDELFDDTLLPQEFVPETRVSKIEYDGGINGTVSAYAIYKGELQRSPLAQLLDDLGEILP
jgi:hypothetical protein